jgi:type IV secretion system protein VirB9
MMRRLAYAMLGGLALGATLPAAQAEQNPMGNAYDARMRTIAYNPGQVVHLATTIGDTMVVSFAATETVTAVAETDTIHLAAVPKGNYLFLKPSGALPLQPVIVLTQRPDGSLRRYVFEIETIAPTPALPRGGLAGLGATVPHGAAGAAGASTTGVYYSVQFTYPADIAAARAAAARAEAARVTALNVAALARAQATAAPTIMNSERTDPDVGPRNYAYLGQGNRSLAPAAVWDNGYSTVFEFAGNARLPSIFVINPDGREATANYSVSGNTVQVAVTAKAFRLRDGHTVLNVYNHGFNTVGGNPETGTTSPDVSRVVKSDGAYARGATP